MKVELVCLFYMNCSSSTSATVTQHIIIGRNYKRHVQKQGFKAYNLDPTIQSHQGIININQITQHTALYTVPQIIITGRTSMMVKQDLSQLMSQLPILCFPYGLHQCLPCWWSSVNNSRSL